MGYTVKDTEIKLSKTDKSAILYSQI